MTIYYKISCTCRQESGIEHDKSIYALINSLVCWQMHIIYIIYTINVQISYISVVAIETSAIYLISFILFVAFSIPISSVFPEI